MKVLFNFVLLGMVLGSTHATFMHPGMLHTAADFERMAAKVNSESTPWITSWNILTANSHASADYNPTPLTIVYRGYDGTHAENYASLFNDVAAAYALALRWKISGNSSFADASVRILDGWSSTLTNISGTSDAALAAGIYGYQFSNAAEIMKDYSGWASENQTQFVDMMYNVFYPINHDFLVRHNDAAYDHYWANWDLCQMASIIAMGILNDNITAFDEAINYFYNGVGNGQIDRLIWEFYTVGGEVLGQGQEAGRDQGHATLDAALWGAFAQMAYNQGTDLFAYDSNRLLAGSEYIAKYNTGYDVPYTPYVSSTDEYNQTVISNSSRGSIRPEWELLYAHYHDLRNLNATYIGLFRDITNNASGGAEGGGGNYGPNSGGYDQLGYGTLTFKLV